MVQAGRPRPRIDWTNTGLLALLHLAAAGALAFPFRPAYLGVMIPLYVACGCAVIGLHRGLTHGAFRSPRWLEALFAWGNAMALMGGPLVWAGRHRLHHRYADTPRDTHSARDSFFWAHLGWILTKSDREADYLVGTRDLAANPGLAWVQRHEALPHLLLLGAALAALGPGGTLWCIYVPLVLCFHMTQCVNSVCHTVGSRTYATPDLSRNVWWLSLATMGEAWHNNHHRHASAANAGEHWVQPDPGWWFIRALALVGLARGLRVTVPARPGFRPLATVAASRSLQYQDP
ncbi:MAG: acyl-CoA desaturase [Planctomycetes bacterium]|nr:acyl-CoA desaturase [Planctomycetota bacterium]